MIKAIIFDFDGVLTDNTDINVKVYQEAAVRCGQRRPSRQEVINVLGMTGPDMVRRLIGRKPQYLVIFRQVWNLYEHKMKLAPGFEAALKKIKLKTAIATSRRHDSLDRSLGKFKKYFSVIITPKNSAKHKPNPEPLLLACKKLKIMPAEAVYVGDTLIDAQTAKKAKTEFIAMLSGGNIKAEFKKHQVKYFIKSLKELPKLIERINL